MLLLLLLLWRRRLAYLPQVQLVPHWQEEPQEQEWSGDMFKLFRIKSRRGCVEGFVGWMTVSREGAEERVFLFFKSPRA
ncbi:hypothetical protein BKA80DRAFT_275249 [Phyllosticta citrichinensis]